MKLAIAIADAHAPANAFVVWRGFAASIPKAAEFGYHGVELALKTAAEVDEEQLAALLARHRIEVSAITTGQVFACLGLYFTQPEEKARRAVIEVFSGLIRLAARFGNIVNIGRARGFIAEGQSRVEAERLFVDTMRRLCDIAGPQGVTLVIEPVNRYEINFINSLDEGAALLALVARPNAGLMPDVFHMNIEDAHIGAALARHAALVKYVHFADSNRLAPGQGHLDFDDIFRGLQSAHYDDWASVEILPKPDPDTAARQAAEFLLPRIAKHNDQARVSNSEYRISSVIYDL